jgi:hypothetical protein
LAVGDVITISTRALGRRQHLLDDWSVDMPPGLGDGDEPITLRMLITAVVQQTVRQFQDRQKQNRFVRVLSQRQIEEQAARGKIDSGGSELDQEVDIGDAVAVALQAFEDGLYLVILDGTEFRDLDAQVYLKPDSRLTFIRLVMLSGG